MQLLCGGPRSATLNPFPPGHSQIRLMQLLCGGGDTLSQRGKGLKVAELAAAWSQRVSPLSETLSVSHNTGEGWIDVRVITDGWLHIESADSRLIPG
jgi:hypothetical protein